MIRKCKATMIGMGLLAILFSAMAQAEVGTPRLKPEYQKWLTEDVRWIITDQERKDFLSLATDSARDKFVVDFWKRRNPTPGSATNVFKEEHYRRLAFANEHFAANLPGWRTDRGRIYVVYGPPDSIDAHPLAEHANAFGSSSDYSYEIWHYKHMNGIGDNQNLRFVDVCRCGDYRMAMP